MLKSLIINRVNLTIKYYPKETVLCEKSDMMASFIVGKSIRWPGNLVLKKDNKIQMSLTRRSELI